MALKIVSIGFNFGLDEIADVELTSTVALADADIIFFNPCFGSYFWETNPLTSGESYMDVREGKRLKHLIQHWRTEIVHAINAGKTVIATFDQPRQFSIEATRSYSGTGKNRVATIGTTKLHNYDAFPVDLGAVTACTTSALSLTRKAGGFGALWKDVSQYFQAEAYFTAPDGEPLLEFSDGSKRVVGATFGANGNFFLLPDYELNSCLFANSEEEEAGEWSEDGRQFAERIKAFSTALHKLQRSDDEPEPDWSKATSFEFNIEAISSAQIEKLRDQQSELEEKVKEIENATHPVRSLRRLLYGSGRRLETSVRSAFEILGFAVSNYKDDEREIDFIAEFEGKRFVGEVEGKDSKPIDVNKLSQLERIMAEDYERPDVSEYARGILVGNAFRLKQPDAREIAFTTKVIQASSRRGIVLIDSVDLFLACRAIINGDEVRRNLARDAILNSTGGMVALN